MITKTALFAMVILIGALTGLPASAQTVKITPLGSHDGELCPFDRALIFEDPDGTRLLYDPGRTVRGGSDPRLDRIDAILLSHVHADHLGDEHQATANAGTCARPEMAVKVTPNSNTVTIALAKQAPIVAGGEMHFFLQAKVKALGGDPAKLVRLVRYGATTSFGKVVVASVPASHTNGLSPIFLEKEQAQALAAAGLTAYVGPAGGFVMRFSNGVVAYLSGDTGITAEQDVVVRRFHRANLAVMSVAGAPNMNGPVEAAYVMNELVQPSSIIITHVNEQATDGGKVRAGTKTEAFIKAVKTPVHVPLSGRTMEFDGAARCVAGC